MLIKKIVKDQDRKYLSDIEEFEEFHCGWYNIPFASLNRRIISSILNLLWKYDIYICGVVDLDGVYPSDFSLVKNPGYCLHTFKASPLRVCRGEFIKSTGLIDRILLSDYFYSEELQYKIDELIYRLNNNNNPWHICFKLSRDKKFLEFYEYTDVF